MCHHWIMNNIVEHARDRQAALHQEASRQRLLLQLAPSVTRFVLLRQIVLFIGNLLIASGTWLKQRSALEQSRVSVSSIVRTGEHECYRYQPNVH